MLVQLLQIESHKNMEKKVKTFLGNWKHLQCVSLLTEQINPHALENVKSCTLRSAVLGLSEVGLV